MIGGRDRKPDRSNDADTCLSSRSSLVQKRPAIEKAEAFPKGCYFGNVHVGEDCGKAAFRGETQSSDNQEGATKLPAIAAICAVAASECSGKATDRLPRLPTIDKATLAYANCVDVAAQKLTSQPDGVDILARRAVSGCRNLRAKALALKGVPVMFPAVAEHDGIHFDLAKHTVEKLRAT